MQTLGLLRSRLLRPEMGIAVKLTAAIFWLKCHKSGKYGHEPEWPAL
jgi:hypothetical protein